VKITVIATGLGTPASQVAMSLNSQANSGAQGWNQPAPVNAQAATIPPVPNAAMVASPVNTMAPAPVIPQPIKIETVTIEASNDFEDLAGDSPAIPESVNPGLAARTPSKDMGTGAEASELARARAIAQRLGITNLTDDEYDVPTYMRRRGADSEL